jgi:hypothetical protein
MAKRFCHPVTSRNTACHILLSFQVLYQALQFVPDQSRLEVRFPRAVPKDEFVRIRLERQAKHCGKLWILLQHFRRKNVA